MDWTMVHAIASAAMFLVGGGAGVYAWIHERLRRRQAHVDDDVNALQTRSNDLERRLAVVEREQETLPTHNDLAQLYERINSQSQSLAALEGQVGRISESLSRVETHLLSTRRHTDG